MKRVLYIGDDYLAGTGMGLVSEFILGGIKEQCEVFHMAINYSKGLRPKTGFRTFTSVSKYPNDFQGYFSLGQKIATIRPDLVIAHNDIDVVMAYYYGVPEIEFEGCNPLKDVPLLVYPPLDTQVIPEEWKKLQEIGKGPFSEKGPTFLATCDWAATLLENAGFAMHPDRFMYEQNDKNIKPLNNIRELKKKWARDPEVDVFLVVSRNDDRKNIRNTVLFLNQLKAYCPKMYVVLKLTGTGQGAIQEADVPKMCPHLKDRLTILSQRLSPNDMNELYNIADFYVNLSRAEGWGHGPVSASILGKPSILTQLPVTDEILNGKYLAIKGKPFPRANGTEWVDPILDNDAALDLARSMASGDLAKLAEDAKSEVKKYENVSVDPILKCIDVVEERRKFMYPKCKLKVMFCGDSPRLYTGYGTVLREFMIRLHKTGKYDLAAHGYVNNPNANKEIELPFPVYSTIDAAQDMGIRNQEQFQQMLEQDKLGFVTFDWAYEKFMPDVVVSVGDIWYAEHIASSVYRENFKHIHYLAIDGEYMPEYTKDGRGIIHPWKEMIKSFDKTVVFTEFGKTEVLKAYGGDLDLAVIPHGVDIEVFKPLSKEKKLEIRKRLGIPENAFVIGTFSRNQIRKQFDVAAQAVAETIRREETIRENKQSKRQNRPIFWLPYCKWDDPQGWNLFHVMSGLSIRDGGPETLLNRAIRIPGIEVGTGYTAEQLNEFYNACDVHLLPYIGEGWGLCLEPNTKISTNRGSVSIKDITIGDEVLSGDGNLHKVLATTSRKVDKLFEIKTKYGYRISVTEEHPFYVMKDGVPDWINVGNIEINDRIGIVKPKGDKPLPEQIDLVDYVNGIEYDDTHVWYRMGFSPKDIKWSYSSICRTYNTTKKIAENAVKILTGKKIHKCKIRVKALELSKILKQDGFELPAIVKVNRYIPIDDEFLEFIGWYMAEGSSNGENHAITIDLHAKEIDVATKLGKYINRAFGLKHIVGYKGENKSYVRVSSGIISTLMATLCGHGAHNKKVPDMFIGSEKYLIPLLRGYLLGDGHFNGHRNHISYSTVSVNLIYQIRNILAAHGIFSTFGSIVHNGRPIYFSKVTSHYLSKLCQLLQVDCSIRRENTRQHTPDLTETEDFFFIPVKEITEIEYSGDVYDISVEESHSFVANGLLAHNTCTESMAAGVVNVIPNFSAPPCYARGAAFLVEPSFYKNDMTTNIKHAYVKPETLANKIGYLYRNPNKLEEISQAAVDRMTAWTWDLAAAKWEPILDSITPVRIKLTVSAPIMKKITDYIDPADKFRILIVMPGMHEDLYYMTGIIDSLHKRYAKNEPSIYLATKPSLFHMFDGFDKIKRLIPYRDEYNNPALEGQLFQIQYTPAAQINPNINWMHHGHGSHAAFTIARTCDVTLGKTYLPKKEAVGLEVIGDFVTIHPSFQFNWEKITSKIKLPVVQLGSYDGSDAIPGTVDGRRFSFSEQMDLISRAKCHIGSDNIFGQAAGYFDIPSVMLYYQGFPQCTGPLYLNKTVYEQTGSCMYNEGKMLFVYAKEPGNPLSIVPREVLLHLAGILGVDNVEKIPDCDITGYGKIEKFHDNIVRNLESTATFCKKIYLSVPDDIKSQLQLDKSKFTFVDTDDMNNLRSMADTTFLWKVDSHDFIPEDMVNAIIQIAHTLPDEIDSVDIGTVLKIKGSVVICDPDTVSVTKLSRRSDTIKEIDGALWKYEKDTMVPIARIPFVNGQAKEILAHQQQGPIFMQRLLSGMPGSIPVIINDSEEGNEDLLKQDNVHVGSYSRSAI